MASSSSAARPAAAEPSPVEFALQELIASWDQAYEALCRGDLDGVGALLDLADAQLATAGDGCSDTEAEARLRVEASSARGRLLHGMHVGLDGLKQELARTRRGGKALRGYGGKGQSIGGKLTKSV